MYVDAQCSMLRHVYSKSCYDYTQMLWLRIVADLRMARSDAVRGMGL